MDALFPFGFPSSTALYLALYVVTLLVHFVFVSYVLAGCLWIAGARGGLVSRTLRDWMPAAISAAITAGVAPLLFLQVLYQREFYTANLLLSHRWMVMLPALIIGFYLAYVLKSKAITSWPRPWRVAVALGAVSCFLFAAWSWAENHLLSLRDQGERSAFYAGGAMVHFEPQLPARLLVWIPGTFMVMTLLVAWQLHARAGERLHRALSATAFVSILVTAAGVAWWFAAIRTDVGDRLASRLVIGAMSGPWAIAGFSGLAVALIAWIGQWRAPALDVRWLRLAAAGTGMSLLGALVVREAFRIEMLGSARMAMIAPRHASAAESGGTLVGVGLLVLNAVIIGWCLWIGTRPSAQPAT